MIIESRERFPVLLPSNGHDEHYEAQSPQRFVLRVFFMHFVTSNLKSSAHFAITPRPLRFVILSVE